MQIRLVGGRGLLVVGDTPERRLAIVADQQSARISTRQLIGLGFTRGMIQTRVGRRQLFRVHQGVYAVGHALEVSGGTETAALLAIGGGAVLGFQSAIGWWGLGPAPRDAVELLLPQPLDRRSRPGIRVRRTSTLARADIKLHRGLPVTAPARALIDFASVSGRRETERALDEGLARRLVSPTKIREAAARVPAYHRGVKTLIALIDPARARGVTRSQAEERMLEIIRSAGIADPERNATIGPYEVDFLWREAGVVVEVDSYEWHSGPAGFKRDRRKDAHLRDQGVDVIRVTWEMMDAPLALVARIVRAVARRAA